ncbi:MAG: GSU2403 family nucleotidyltransferase fold protein [bacterium]
MIDLIRKILKVFANNNLFEEGVELIGSWCFQLYKEHLGAKEFPLRTQDIDFLIPNPFRGNEHREFIEQIEALGFRCNFNKDGSVYFWNSEIKIEFISPEKGRGSDAAILVKKLGIKAIPLRFVNLLLENPITIVDNGLKIKVPNPVNFCLQKLIISTRRRKPEKIAKDIQQAICTSTIIDMKKLYTEYITLPVKWRKAIIKSLNGAKDTMPLYIKDIEKLFFTLQKTK